MTHGLFRNFFHMFINFPIVFLLLISNLILSGWRTIMNSVQFHPFNFLILWYRIWFIFLLDVGWATF